ncbi:MAG: DUF4159 domain-containing protein [Elusimicrobiota bacterium]
MAFKKIKVYFFLTSILLLISTSISTSIQRDRFVFTQLKYSGDWDPYPAIWPEINGYLTLTTSIKTLPDRRIVSLTDDLLFNSPFVVMLNSGRFDGFTVQERARLKKYLELGGTIFIEDSSAIKNSRFDSTIRKELQDIFSGRKFIKMPKDSPVFRSFYLLRGIGGRQLTNNYMEAIEISGRSAIMYSQNDFFGTWGRDRFGNYFYNCIPGGENQRFESLKFTINLIMYSITGTYKSDFIHKQFIEEKLKR